MVGDAGSSAQQRFSLIAVDAGCDISDVCAPLPHQHQIRRMMKRQVLECGIQVMALLCVLL
jgi:hypothetical protein